MNNPIIVTHNKKTKEKWLSKKIKYEDNFTNNDIIKEMFREIDIWLSINYDLELIDHKEDFKLKFINLLYDKYSF